jgi:hypothetical protein
MDRGVIVGGLLVASSLVAAVFFNSHAPDPVPVDSPAVRAPAVAIPKSDGPAIGIELPRTQAEPSSADRSRSSVPGTAEIY